MAQGSMRARFFGSFTVVLVLPLFYECANLVPLTPGVCGNGVVDPGEDCDGFADAAAHEACGAPSAGPLACRFTCAASAACPTGYNCGNDLICRAPSGAFEPLGAPLSVGADGVTLADFNGDGLADALTHGPIDPIGSTHVQVSYLSATGGLLGSFVVSDRLGSPAVADLNGDGLADLAATLQSEQGVHSGVTAFLGQATNTLASTSFPTTSVPAGVAAIRSFFIPGFAAGPRTVYFATGGGYQTGLYLPAGLGAPVLSTSPASGTFRRFRRGRTSSSETSSSPRSSLTNRAPTSSTPYIRRAATSCGSSMGSASRGARRSPSPRSRRPRWSASRWVRASAPASPACAAQASSWETSTGTAAPTSWHR